jgi:hypothetical protein
MNCQPKGWQFLYCLFQTACFARGHKRNDGSTFVLLFFRQWPKIQGIRYAGGR